MNTHKTKLFYCRQGEESGDAAGGSNDGSYEEPLEPEVEMMVEEEDDEEEEEEARSNSTDQSSRGGGRRARSSC